VAADDGTGQALGEIAASTGLDAGTARRLLSALVARGFVDQDRLTRRYHLGIEVFTLAAAASNRLDFGGVCRDALLRMSRLSGCDAALMIGAGGDLICLDLVRAAEDRSTRDLSIGDRRLIGGDAFGIAILAGMSDQQAEDIVIGNIRALTPEPEQGVVMIREHLQAARRDGYCLWRRPLSGRGALAVAVADHEGRPVGAFGVSLPDAGDVPAEMLGLQAQDLRLEARRIEEVLWRDSDGKGRGQ